MEINELSPLFIILVIAFIIVCIFRIRYLIIETKEKAKEREEFLNIMRDISIALNKDGNDTSDKSDANT